MRIRVASHHRKAVIVARSQRRLQAVVVGTVDVSHLKHLGQVWELATQRSSGLFAMSARDLGSGVRVHLVDVANADEARSMIADIGHFQNEIGSERML